LADYDELALAAVNGPRAVVVAGPAEQIDALAEQLEDSVRTKRLRVSHAFHSPLVEPAAARFEELARGFTFSAPKLPIAPNLTGALLTDAEATDPAYWAAALRSPVRLAAGLGALADAGAPRPGGLGPGPPPT